MNPRRQRTLIRIAAVVASAGILGTTAALSVPTADAVPSEWMNAQATIPESNLSPQEIEAGRKVTSVPAVWDIHTDGMLVWDMPAGPDDIGALSPSLRPGATPTRKTAWFAGYDRSTVGPYKEFGALLQYRNSGGYRLNIPFLPVSTAESMVSAREMAGTPKVIGTFSEERFRPGNTVVAKGDGWSITARVETLTGQSGPTPPLMADFTSLPFEQSMFRVEHATKDGRRWVQDKKVKATLPPSSLTAIRVHVTTVGSPQLRRLVPSGTYTGVYIPTAAFEIYGVNPR
ncbi:Acetoacetate decarboxylase (ADC) [Gordonia paraffinivorans]|uniref:Acetoacetate decarboxylase (ADC) n=1 Tax=Gordonia paraffinivorans TaxID=175628 RepID=A0ABD7UXU6_9ACTN|nr:acetoacetate decarboxylase family protein [Gordonia paraffinivorans]VFA81215.1 Acetoacetate decarboxylase (ADC) [Gordonia paraffinivorans]